MTMLADLHTHSTASDGALKPVELVERALERGITHLAITDHDTVAAYDTDLPHDRLHVITGIELSTVWRRIGIHIVGLNIDLANTELADGIRQQQDARRRRAETIAKRLVKTGIDDPLPAVTELAGSSTIGRPHFARHLVNIGHVRDLREAYKKYLGDGKTGDVRQHWASLPDVVGWIRAAGGVAVLAHPSHYGQTMTKLRELLEDFHAAGGRAIEVVSGRQDAATTRRLAGLATEFNLLASCGSDFHRPAGHGADLGCFPSLPPECRPVWDGWF